MQKYLISPTSEPKTERKLQSPEYSSLAKSVLLVRTFSDGELQIFDRDDES